MIPGPLISWQLLVLVFLLPLLGGLLTASLVLYALHFFLRKRGSAKAFFSWKIRILCALAVLSCGWIGYVYYAFTQIERGIAIEQWYKESRRRFVLDRDFQYGELHVPAGTLVNLYDAFDNGEPQRALGLRGLDALQFPQPVEVAGLWVSALETSPGRLTLARDQRVGPMHHYDAEQNDWVPDPSRPYVDCKAGQNAWFHTPLIDYDIQAEFLTGEPDGAQARFRPSQWRFTHCESDGGALKVEPAFAESPPDGAGPPVFLPASG